MSDMCHRTASKSGDKLPKLGNGAFDLGNGLLCSISVLTTTYFIGKGKQAKPWH